MLKNSKVIIIGGGILGLSLSRRLLLEGYKNITLLEKESTFANHQSSRNSGVMHAGLYYKPGSLKAKLSRKGISLMKTYCNEHNIQWDECGKIVVATDNSEIQRLDDLYRRGKKNNLKGIKMINSREANSYEPYVEAKKAIFVPEESIVDYKKVAKKYQEEILALGGSIKYKSKVLGINNLNSKQEIVLENGELINSEVIISTAGLYSDRVTKMLGIDIENKQTLPFRGEYFLLKPEYEYLVKGLIYPVPNPKLPFLGVHFTRMIGGGVEAGPNAVLAMAREGYDWKTINMSEFYESITYPGLHKFILKYPLITAGEIIRSLSKQLFVKSLKKLIPEIRADMITYGPAGIRAQLMNLEGSLEQDFDIRIKGNFISVLNAPSPAATSSLSIADYIAKFITN